MLKPDSWEESEPGDMEKINQCHMLSNVHLLETGRHEMSIQFTHLSSDKVLACEKLLIVIKASLEIVLERGSRGSIWLAMTHHPTKVSTETHRVQNESAYFLNNFS